MITYQQSQTCHGKLFLVKIKETRVNISLHNLFEEEEDGSLEKLKVLLYS